MCMCSATKENQVKKIQKKVDCSLSDGFSDEFTVTLLIDSVRYR